MANFGQAEGGYYHGPSPASSIPPFLPAIPTAFPCHSEEQAVTQDKQETTTVLSVPPATMAGSLLKIKFGRSSWFFCKTVGHCIGSLAGRTVLARMLGF